MESFVFHGLQDFRFQWTELKHTISNDFQLLKAAKTEMEETVESFTFE